MYPEADWHLNLPIEKKTIRHPQALISRLKFGNFPSGYTSSKQVLNEG